MGLRARYDAGEDRILLAFDTSDSVVQFWMTRRRWIAIIKALSDIPVEASLREAEPPRAGKVAPSGSLASEHPPVSPTAVRIRNTGRGARLVFERRDAPQLLFNCTHQEIPALLTFFREQGDLAGWDVAAALARMGHSQRKIKSALLH